MISKTKTNTEKTVAYIRASSDQQMAASPARQKADCRAIVKRFDLPPIEDDGFYAESKARSGLKINNRAALAQMLVDAENGVFDVVVFTEFSRLSRGEMADQVILWKRIQDAGVRIFTDIGEVRLDDLGSWIQASVQAHQSREESKRLSKRSSSGKRAKLGLNGDRKPEYLFKVLPGFKKEFYMDGRLIGVIRYTDPPGIFEKPNGAKCVVKVTDDQNELDAIRAVFQSLAEGNNSRVAADVFNSYGVKTWKGNKWTGIAIRSLCRLPQFIGQCKVGKNPTGEFSNVTDSETIIDGICPAIIDRRTWDDAQRTLDTLGRHSGRRRRETGYLLSGLMFSPTGRKFYGREVAPGKLAYTTAGNEVPKGEIYSIRCHMIDNVVLSMLESFISDPATIKRVGELLEDELRTVEAVADPTAAELQSVRESIEKAAKRIVSVDDDGAVAIINQEIRRLRQRETELKERQDRARERGQRTAAVHEALAVLPDLLKTRSHELESVLPGFIERIVVGHKTRGVWWARVEFIEGDPITLTDRHFNGHMIAHRVADYVEENGPVSTHQIAEAVGVLRQNVYQAVKSAKMRGRAIEQNTKGEWVCLGEGDRGSITRTKKLSSANSHAIG